MNIEHNAESILERLLTATGLRRDAQLASLLGVSPQAVSQARKKNRVPESWLVRLAAQYHLSVEWLLHGESANAAPGGEFRQAIKTAPPTLESLRPAPRIREPEPSASVEVAFVPLVAASLSAGTGSLESEGEVLDYFAFHHTWLCRKGNPENMVLMKVYGDSMEPEIRHGDMVLVDQGKTRIFGHTMYAVGVNEEIYVKQIETLPGNRMLLRSLNERYDPIEVDLRGDMADSVRIIGKVIWWCREA